MIILNVDDDAEDRQILLEALKTIDPVVDFLEAKDGVEAISLLSEGLLHQKLNCMFIDINMPLMDGIVLLALIKGDQRLSKIPVYIYSTSDNEIEIAKVRSLGAAYIRKQSNFRNLTQTLSSILKLSDASNCN
jgi:CheY-like chemotaxis protein